MIHMHSEWTAWPNRQHEQCVPAGWRCTRCLHDHDQNPRCCQRCGYTVLAPTWAAKTEEQPITEPTADLAERVAALEQFINRLLVATGEGFVMIASGLVSAAREFGPTGDGDDGRQTAERRDERAAARAAEEENPSA